MTGSAREAALVVRVCARTALERQAPWDELDLAVGDGDFGSTLARGARAVLALDPTAEADAAGVLRAAALALTREMGGSSGPLVGVLCLRAAAALEAGSTAGEALAAGIEGIKEYGGADVGDATMLDALVPAAAALQAGAGETATELLDAAATAAEAGAASTRGMTATRGRASYTGERSAEHADPGAVAVGELLRAVRAAWGEDPGSVAAPASSAAADPEAEDAVAASPPRGFYDDPTELLRGALRGLQAADPAGLRVDLDARVVLRADAPTGRVALVSGGGSGHEPLHGGFVGAGMLDAACPGEVFTSPSPDQVVAASRAVASAAGVLHVVKNYTGDVLNFRLAAELLRDEHGIVVETVLVAEDVATAAGDGPGRRGTAATLVVEKVAGARAAAGGSLEEVAEVARRCASRARSFAIALGPAHLPGAGVALDLPAGEAEVGVGIHGEPGVRRERYQGGAWAAATMLDAVLAELPPAEDAGLLVLVNGLGGTSQLELLNLHGLVVAGLQERGLAVARSLVGSFVTSLDMAGASLTLVALDAELTQLWDAPASTGGLVR